MLEGEPPRFIYIAFKTDLQRLKGTKQKRRERNHKGMWTKRKKCVGHVITRRCELDISLVGWMVAIGIGLVVVMKSSIPLYCIG